MITDYDSLKAEIQGALDNTNPNLIAAIPMMIQLLEAESDRDLATCWQNECLSTHPIVPTGTADADRGTYALPADWGGYRQVLRKADVVEVLYWRKIPKLSDSVTNNWLLDEHPDYYLFGSLANSEAWLKNDKRITLWAQAANIAKEQIQIASQREAFSGDQMRMRMDDETPWRGGRSGTGRLKFMKPGDFHDMAANDASNRNYTGYAGWYTTSAGKLRIWPIPGNDPADVAGWSSCA